jgi:glycosyltransferase involved in cell wall biosynthesis
MRIAYISLHWPRPRSSGIGRKIEGQLTNWRQEGHTVHFFSHHTRPISSEELVPGENFEFDTPGGAFGRILTEINRCLAVLPLIKALRDFSPDLIYLRWGMYVFPSYKIFQIAPVVIEINTNDVIQHEILGTLLSSYNRLTRCFYLSKAAGFVYISDELATSESFSTYHHPGIVIANGIDLAENIPMDAPCNARPRLGFIGSPDMVWHGVDKLMRLALLCPEMDIDVIGIDRLDDGRENPSNLFFHGYLDREKAKDALSRVDVGLGTLALHRINMNEASPLKTREYLAYGIPTIFPYKDSDLDNVSIDTILKIPNTEDNIEKNWKKIKEFTFQMRGKRVNRELIGSRIGLKYKETTRLKFFQECIIGTSSTL